MSRVGREGPRGTCANCWEAMKDVVGSSRAGKSSWRIKRATKVLTTASCHQIVAAHEQSAPTAQNHVVNSWIKTHMWNRSQSHEMGTRRPTANKLQLLRARVWGLANVLRRRRFQQHSMPSLLDSPDATMQHSRDGHELEPRVHQDGRRWRTGAAKPKTAPTQRQPDQTSPNRTARANRRASTI